MRRSMIAALLYAAAPVAVAVAPFVGPLAGMVVVADGTPRAARCLERVLTSDPGMGIIRHADAGYDEAIRAADERGVVIPRRRQ